MEYKEKLRLAKEALKSGSYDRDTIEYIFPELKESEDEKIRERLTDFIERLSINPHSPKPPKSTLVDCLAWLKELGEQQPLYIRFGEIPDNEKSKIYRGEEEIGEEDGVSVYPAFEVNGDIVLGLTLPITKTTLYTQQHLLEYDNRPCYLVKGDYVGKDTDGQPLINNIQIIKEIDNYRVKEEVDDANGYGIKESGSPYPTKSDTFSEHKSDCEHVGCHINGTKRWCHKLQSEVPYEKCSDKCPGYSSKQKSNDELEPTFKVGDWVVRKDGENFGNGRKFAQITNIDEEKYWFESGTWLKKKEIRFWSINDAKAGDILVSKTNKPFIYNGSFDDDSVSAYCGLNLLNEFMTTYPPYFWTENKDVRPATREQCDTLFEKMKEAGYTLDSEKKELNKITKFKVGDWVVEPREDDPNILWHIDRIIDGFYWDGSNGVSIEIADKYYHVWSLDDANDGDILVSSITNKPFIYNGKFNENHVGGYCGVGYDDEFVIAHTQYYWTEKKDIVPATKEQRDTLFAKMEEMGYEWNAENKKLNNKYSTIYSKIKDKIDNLQTSVQELNDLTDDDKSFLNAVSDLLEKIENK